MPLRADHVVVSFAAFVERRERRARTATTPGEHDLSDLAVERPLAAVVAMTGAGGQARPAATAATEERE
jgi:hypothetical protein